MVSTFVAWLILLVDMVNDNIHAGQVAPDGLRALVERVDVRLHLGCVCELFLRKLELGGCPLELLAEAVRALVQLGHLPGAQTFSDLFRLLQTCLLITHVFKMTSLTSLNKYKQV